MFGRSGVSQEWSVHAQFTVSHHRPADGAASDVPPPSPVATPERDSGGVRMEYLWSGQPPSSSSVPSRTCYGFQRGNMLFTTRPPPREPQSVQTPTPCSGQQRLGATHLLDSGYSSEHVSPGSYASLPTRRPAQPYSRRCKSTCSIVLSGSEQQGVASASMKPDVGHGPAYTCGDPVCFLHRQTSPLPCEGQVRPRSSDFAPLPEICEVCGGGRSPTAVRRASAANTFTTHFCTRVPERVLRETDRPSRDVASQTSDHMLSTTAPGMGVTSPCGSKPVQPKMGNKVVYGGARRKTDSELLQLPVIDISQPDVEPMKVSLRSIVIVIVIVVFIRWTISFKVLTGLK